MSRKCLLVQCALRRRGVSDAPPAKNVAASERPLYAAPALRRSHGDRIARERLDPDGDLASGLLLHPSQEPHETGEGAKRDSKENDIVGRHGESPVANKK